MPPEASRYARIEYERRFLVRPGGAWRERLEGYSKTLEDKYLTGTRLRLRRLTDSDTGRRLWKLTRKDESPSPYHLAMTTILLTEPEFACFDALEGERLRKVRHYLRHQGRVLSVDAFEGELAGLVLCEVEADSLEELLGVQPPDFVLREVTGDPFFTGGNLCRLRQADLLSRL